MKNSLATQFIFLLVCAFFASFPFWLPDVSQGNEHMVKLVSYVASAMGLVGIYYIVLSIVFQVVPFTMEADAIRVEKVRMLPPGKRIIHYPYAWIHSFTYHERITGPSDRRRREQWFEIILNHEAKGRFGQKRRHRIAIDSGVSGSPQGIERSVNQRLRTAPKR